MIASYFNNVSNALVGRSIDGINITKYQIMQAFKLLDIAIDNAITDNRLNADFLRDMLIAIQASSCENNIKQLACYIWRNMPEQDVLRRICMWRNDKLELQALQAIVLEC